MRILTLTQPWATLVAIGAKRVETRSWRTGYRGDIGIHAAKTFPRAARDICYQEPFATGLKGAGITLATELPRGEIVAVARLQDCVATTDVLSWISEHERAFGDYSPGRFAWVFGARAIPLSTPIKCDGHLGLWTPEPFARGSLVEQGFAA